MSQPQLPQETPYQPYEGERLGVIDAMGMGWRFMMSDFWPLWLVAFVFTVINAGLGLFGSIPYIGGCFALAAAIFVRSQLEAGLYYAIRQRVDGAAAEVGNLFEGFRSRYWHSVLAMLPVLIAGVVFGIVIAVAAMVAGFAAGNQQGGQEALIAIVVVIAVVGIIAVGIFTLFFIFALLAVWDHPESGWQAAMDSMRLVKENFLSVLGLGVLFALIGLGAAVAGLIALCVGVLFTMPIVTVWFCATAVYLYRSWRGEPLVQQPLGPGGIRSQGWEGPGAPPAAPPGAIPPASP